MDCSVADGRKPRFLTKMVVIGRLCYGGPLLSPLCQAKIRIWPQETRKPPLPTCDPVLAGTSRRRSEPFVNHPLWPTRHDVAPSSGATSYWYIRPCMTDVCIRGLFRGSSGPVLAGFVPACHWFWPVLGRFWPIGRCWPMFNLFLSILARSRRYLAQVWL